ncbi:HNH endonuclease [Rhizobium sp. NZLR8]|uniref:HNH endonuclease n=1 Tax=Rhizobium sp. NZLR8 TaxID=2731104 RepID=UPI0038FD0D2B
MWETDPKSFSSRFALTGRATLEFQCTAEHLEARCDGGRDTNENVVAACRYCNGNRHKRKRPKDAVSYMGLVRSRMEQGRWHRVTLVDTPRPCMPVTRCGERYPNRSPKCEAFSFSIA